MKLSYFLPSALLALGALSTPLVGKAGEVASKGVGKLTGSLAAIRDADASAVGLVKRKNEYCNIVNVATTVDCWWLPKHNGNGNHKVTSIAGTTKNVEFGCYTNCEDVGGNTSWDWSVVHECYVPGYYTDAACSRANLGQCSWAGSDQSFGGCS